jgi:hypothetical protein
MRKFYVFLGLLMLSVIMIIATNNAFATVVTVTLVDENGNPLANYPTGSNELSYQYRCGGTWVYPGAVQTDANGQFKTVDITCGNWDGKITVTLNQTSLEKVVSNNEVLFQAAKVNVNLKNCPGTPLSGGTVEQRGGHGVTHGITDASGTVSFYAFPGKSVTVRMSYHYGSNQIGPTTVISPSTQINFVTTRVNFDATTVKVGSSGWPTIPMPYEMLPGTYNFRIDGVQIDGVVISGCDYPPVNVIKLENISVTSETCLVKGTVTVTFSGGAAPFNINWGNGSAEEIYSPYKIEGLDAGNYTITVTDANGGSVSQVVTIESDKDFPSVPELYVTNPTCENPNGSVAITSVTTDLTFSFNGGDYAEYTEAFTVMGEAEYSITAKNLSGCKSPAATGTMGASLTVPDAPTLSVTPPTCDNQNGLVAITSDMTGLTFSIDGTNYAAYAGPFTVEGGASYSITVMNLSGCVSLATTGTMAASLTVPEAPTLSVTPPTCDSQNGLVAITSDITGLTFSIDGINYTEYTEPFTVMGGAEYRITAKNLSGCVSPATTGTMAAPLTVPQAPTLSVTPPTCSNSNGSVTITSDMTDLTFSIDGTNYSAYTAPFTVAGGAGYSITAKNLSGCVSLASTGTMGASLTVPDAPTITTDGVTTFCEGGSVTLTSSDGSSYLWSNGENTASIIVYETGNYSLQVTNEDGCQSEASEAITVTVISLPEIIIEITANPAVPIQIGTYVALKVDFTDENLVDAVIDWGDGGDPDELKGKLNEINLVHPYGEVGVYSVIVTLTDACGNVTSKNYDYVVVYDPTAGFVTGGGWINSPAGAYIENPGLTGKATFGFVSKYNKGATIPSGNTEFQFHAAGMNFKSTDYDWLVIAGMKAQFKGSGTINGSGEYGFMLTAIDGTPDKFRIKIWDKSNDAIVYDNQITDTSDNADPSTALGGGSIVIHTPKTKSAEIGADVNPFAEQSDLKVYPNPFADRLRFEFVSPESVNARIDLYDMTGRLVKTIFEQPVEGGVSYEAEFRPETIISGMYFYRVQMGEAIYNGKAVFKKD